MKDKEDVAENIRQILACIGEEDVSREGLKETPRRFTEAFEFLTEGYRYDVSNLFKTFECCDYDEMVILKDIEFYSLCEHHMLPFFGTISIGYLPNQRIIGISKLSKLANILAHKLTTQEMLTTEIADTIQKYLKPFGVIVVIRATHLCMSMRKIAPKSTTTITSAIRGIMKHNPYAKAEFLELLK